VTLDRAREQWIVCNIRRPLRIAQALVLSRLQIVDLAVREASERDRFTPFNLLEESILCGFMSCLAPLGSQLVRHECQLWWLMFTPLSDCAMEDPIEVNI